MKVSYFNYVQGRAGDWVHVTEFAKAFQELGHEISVHWENQADKQQSGSSNSSTGQLRRFLARYGHQPKQLLKNVPYILQERRAIAGDVPDVVLARHHPLTCSALLAAKMNRRPLVLEVNAVQDLEFSIYNKQYANLPMLPKAVERLVFQWADAITVVSRVLKDHIVSTFNIEDTRIYVNPNGVDVERFADNSGEQSARDSQGGKHAIRVGFIGTFQAFHGTDVLIAAIERIVPVLPDIRFVIVGDGPHKPEFLATVAAKGLRNHVEDLGQVEYSRVPECLSGMSICVMPGSNNYGSPLKVMEYMAAGRPVVAPNLPPIADVIENGKNGLLFAPDSVEQFVAAILNLARDAQLRKRFGCEARNTILSNYTWRHNALRVEAACKMAMKAHGRKGEAKCPA